VRVETDAGIIGWGEAFGYAAGPVTMAALTRIVAPFAIGRDVTDIPALMGDLWFRTKGMSRNGPVAFALSGLDIALWDLKGKVAGAPIWRLLGGAGRQRVEAYASLMRLALRMSARSRPTPSHVAIATSSCTSIRSRRSPPRARRSEAMCR